MKQEIKLCSKCIENIKNYKLYKKTLKIISVKTESECDNSLQSTIKKISKLKNQFYC